MTDLGVVDPIRLPASVGALTVRIRQLPPYAIAFLGAFGIRAAADIVSAVSPIGIQPSTIIAALVLGSIPDWLILLLPVAVAWSTLTLGEASSRVVRGAIAVGLSEIAATIAWIVSGGQDPFFLVPALVRLGSAVLLAGGLIWIAHGLEALRTTEPAPATRRAAVAAVVVGLAAAGVELVARVAQLAGLAGSESFDDTDRSILLFNTLGLAHILVLCAWAYVAWVLIRADRDSGRPPAATRMGAAAGWLAIAWLGTSLISLALLPLVGESPDGLAGSTTVQSAFFVLSLIAATCTLASLTALAAGFARGLAFAGASDDEAPTG